MIFLLLTTFDTIITMVVINGGGTELNPVLGQLVDHDLLWLKIPLGIPLIWAACKLFRRDINQIYKWVIYGLVVVCGWNAAMLLAQSI